MATITLAHETSPRRRSFFRTLRLTAVVVLTLGLAIAVWANWRIQACLPQLEGTIHVSGLKAPVEVLRDARGVPHLRARSLEDLVFAQGYVTAQDRLFQMDLSRRLAEGELAQIVGERALKIDIESRTLGLPQVLNRAAVDLPPDGRGLVDAYSRGVNAFISTHSGNLPVEFLHSTTSHALGGPSTRLPSA